MWAWGFCFVLLFAGFCSPKWLFWVFVEKGVKIHRFGIVGAVLTVDPGLVVEMGPDDVAISAF